MRRPMDPHQESFMLYMPSVTGAMKGKRILQARGFLVTLEKVSRRGSGCGYALRLRGERTVRNSAERVLKGAGIPFETEEKERSSVQREREGGGME